VSGLLGAFAYLYPDTTVYFYFIFPMSARVMALLLCAAEFAMTMSGGVGKISNITHLGGLAAGVAWLWAERRWRERPARPERPRPDPAALEREEIDRLLEKISRGGRGSLSRAELARLDEYSRKGGKA